MYSGRQKTSKKSVEQLNDVIIQLPHMDDHDLQVQPLPQHQANLDLFPQPPRIPTSYGSHPSRTEGVVPSQADRQMCIIIRGVDYCMYIQEAATTPCLAVCVLCVSCLQLMHLVRVYF